MLKHIAVIQELTFPSFNVFLIAWEWFSAPSSKIWGTPGSWDVDNIITILSTNVKPMILAKILSTQ